MIKIGIDPSINCTGICVSYESLNIYYMIPSKMTKKMLDFKHEYINIIPYIKNSGGGEYPEKEKFKTYNIYSICGIIKNIINDITETHVGEEVSINMEGVSYGSVGSAALVDLSGLNFAIRITLLNMGLDINIISPTSVKKFAVANGGAEKDIIIDAWRRLDKNISQVKNIKIDDLADSFFLAHYE